MTSFCPGELTLKEMRKKVQEELQYIPKHPAEHQSDLRMAYFAMRMHSLGKKAKEEKTASDVLRDCIEQLSKECPEARFHFDEEFFKGAAIRQSRSAKKAKKGS